MQLAGEGIESTLAPQNRRLLPGLSANAQAALLLDPQTSGGLLAGVAPESAAKCVSDLRAAGIQAAIIGIIERGEPAIRLDPGAS